MFQISSSQCKAHTFITEEILEMTSPNPFRGPIQSNNLAVSLYREGKIELAITHFQAALKCHRELLGHSVSTPLYSSIQAPHDRPKVTLNSIISDNHGSLQSEGFIAVSGKGKTETPPSSMICEQTIMTAGKLCQRPLELPGNFDPEDGEEVEAISTTIVFNLGLSLHAKSMVSNAERASQVQLRSIRMYELAIQMLEQNGSSIGSIVFVLLILHNIARVYGEVGDKDASRSCWERLLSTSMVLLDSGCIEFFREGDSLLAELVEEFTNIATNMLEAKNCRCVAPAA